jgi:flavodoxin
MKPLIVFQTETGNTIHIAEAMAAATQADLIEADRLTPADLEDRTLVGLGSGIYTMAHMPQIIRLVPRIPVSCRAFIFSTSGSAGWMPAPAYRFTHWRLRTALRRRKIAILGEWDCPGQVKGGILGWFGLYRGRPGDADLAAAARFAQQMLGKANGTSFDGAPSIGAASQENKP